jgi:tetratricopeptide (TPR) repeat protein
MLTAGPDLLQGKRAAMTRRLAACLVIVAAASLPLRGAYADDLAICNSQNLPPEQAIAACDRLINAGKSKGSELASRYLNRGLAWNRKGDFDRELSDYNRAIALDPKFGIAYLNRGTVWHRKGQYDQAVADYSTAISLGGNVNLALAYNNRGNSRRLKGELDDAIDDLNRAIDLDPRYVLAYSNRGQVWMPKGKYDSALADFNKVIELDPKNADAYNYRGGGLRPLEQQGSRNRGFCPCDHAAPGLCAGVSQSCQRLCESGQDQ